ncbi:BglG family transcription antiterminator [Microbacterium amylolyticum]|uniref:Lichenan operon transcriptional antiterminator n=1 Tax=Microbacterium amylolyticum TaxID=936337 RepID=A0ABS4ZJS6_9MICO|nr:PTS sugar transporter subunit IIA [Microbacterium amylolyticum]MBP2437542.1 lichenan operon transcriptional antiterminator [Microbacterium amylolyticum]
MLFDEPDGINIYDAASRLFVSESTVEADLRRVRSRVRDTRVRLERDADTARLAGSERDLRLLIGDLVHDRVDEERYGPEALRSAAASLRIPADRLEDFANGVFTTLSDLGYIVDELAVADVALHVTITADRVRGGHALTAARDQPDVRIIDAMGDLAARHFGVEFGAGDRVHVAQLSLLAVVGARSEDLPTREPDTVVSGAVRAAIQHVSATYGVDVSQRHLAVTLEKHVQNLVDRAEHHVLSRNPMTRALKSASPLLFEMAVSFVGELSDVLGAAVPDDEIAGIAMHLGGVLEAGRALPDRLRALIVCPGYEHPGQQLRQSITRMLGHEIEIVSVDTRFSENSAGTDLILTTIELPARSADMADAIVRIPPFLTDRDITRISDVVSRVRRSRRLSGLRSELQRWFLPGAFISDIDPAASPEDIIRRLGALLVAEGVIDEAYVDSTIERERLSSTAFTESLAVPHAMTMSAARTAIAIGVSEQAIGWGTDRVHVVAFAAFSAADRSAFQAVFEQFVDVFSGPDNGRRIARKGNDLPSFLTEVVALIDG